MQVVANLGAGAGGAHAKLSPLPARFTYEQLLGQKLLRCGRNKMLHDTSEELHEDGLVVVLFFGVASAAPSRAFARKLKTLSDRIARADKSRFEVVYMPLDGSQLEYDRFTLREAAGWWALPWDAKDVLGKRALKHMRVQGVPTAVVTRWKVVTAEEVAEDPKLADVPPYVELLNNDAAEQIANDPKGVGYPWKGTLLSLEPRSTLV